jgi:hypothetical protein
VSQEGREVPDHVYGGVPPAAVRVVVYGWLAMAAGSEHVLKVKVAPPALVMVSEKFCWAVSCGELESETWIVKAYWVAVVGVPESTPPELRFRPGGRAVSADHR